MKATVENDNWHELLKIVRAFRKIGYVRLGHIEKNRSGSYKQIMVQKEFYSIYANHHKYNKRLKNVKASEEPHEHDSDTPEKTL